MALHGHFLRVPRNYEISMIGMDQARWEMSHIRNREEITSRPKIWCHDATRHEADHYLKWPRSVNVRIFWFRPAEGAVVLWISCLLCHGFTIWYILFCLQCFWGKLTIYSFLFQYIHISNFSIILYTNHYLQPLKKRREMKKKEKAYIVRIHNDDMTMTRCPHHCTFVRGIQR